MLSLEEHVGYQYKPGADIHWAKNRHEYMSAIINTT